MYPRPCKSVFVRVGPCGSIREGFARHTPIFIVYVRSVGSCLALPGIALSGGLSGTCLRVGDEAEHETHAKQQFDEDQAR